MMKIATYIGLFYAPISLLTVSFQFLSDHVMVGYANV